MAEGVLTRSKAHDEALAGMVKEVKDVVAVVHQHSDEIATYKADTEQIKQSIAEINLTLARMERFTMTSTLPPLLPTPTVSSSSFTMPTMSFSPSMPTLLSNAVENHNELQPRVPKLEIPFFSGDNVTGWLFQIDRFFLYHRTPPEQKLTVAAFYMSGAALQWFQWMHTTRQLSTWEFFVRDMELRFGPSSFVNYEAALYKLRQTTTVAVYMAEFESLSIRTPGLTATNLLNCFISGLRDDIRRELLLLKPSSLHEAIGMAKLVEEKLEATRHTTQRPPPIARSLTAPGPPGTKTPLSLNQGPKFPIKKLTSAEMAARRERGLCFNCDERFVPGHRCKPLQFLCMLVEDEDTEPASETVMSEEENAHSPLSEELSPGQDTVPSISFHALEGHQAPTTLRLQGTMSGQPVTVLVDSGSTHNFLQSRLVRYLGLPIEPSNYLKVTVGNGSSLHCEGVCSKVPLTIGSFHFSVDLYVLPIYGADLVLGVQWLASLGPVLFDYNSMWMTFKYAGTEHILQGVPSMAISTMTISQLRRSEMTDSVASYFQLTITPIHEQTPAAELSASTQFAHITDPQNSTALRSVLQTFQDVFAVPHGLPPRRHTDHKIPLQPHAAPVNVKPYRYPHFQKGVMEKLINEMLAEGIIRHSTSPFSSPVLLVKKKDGSWRFCVDYRALNAITIKDRFPIPTVDELLDELTGATVFSKLDLRAGYHQLRVQPEDVQKTAFRTHEGHYEFLVMPFGLSNAPASFQAEMNNIFRPVLRKFVLVFFDDILVYSSSWEAHLHHLSRVLQILRTHNFYAKHTKCEFGQTSLTYLGHIISAKGVAVDPAKVDAVRHWPLPVNCKQLRGFLGLAGYYRRFVASYAQIAAPLTQLLRKEAFIWGDEATSAFESLKTALSSTPVLALPDFSQPFIVQTDASGNGVGAVLVQAGRPLAFFSRQLCPKLQTSSTYVRELYAVTEAVKKWRQYLLGAKFVIQTDHQPLRTLMTQAVHTPEQQKWITKLIGYDFDIVYRPGKENGPADALSRQQEGTNYEQEGNCYAMQIVSKPIIALLAALREYYKRQPSAMTMIQSILDCPKEFEHYTVRDGLVFFKNRLFIPPESALQELVMHEYHSSPVGGHAGMQRTLARLSTSFYWPGLRNDVRRFVSTCATCQQVKPINAPPGGLLQPLPIPGRIWESISMDFITHLPASKGRTMILVVVDRLSKYAHFSAMRNPLTAVDLAAVFVTDICRLHGFPNDIVSDRDPLFMSTFWQELFRLQGTSFSTSSAYHPQTDGQTEVLNRCLEDYLRSFAADHPATWGQFLPWAEWHYNTAWHSAIKMTPFEAVYGRTPPTLQDYTRGTSPIAAVDDLLSDRSTVLATLKANLQRAQLRMKNQADAHRTDRELQPDDWAFIKLQPYRQTSVARRPSHKLAKRYYGPFRVVDRIGSVAYRLQLPTSSRIHNVFHISLLKKCRGDPASHRVDLPAEAMGSHPRVFPTQLLGFRRTLQQGKIVPQLLVQWHSHTPDEATWEPAADLQQDFPEFHLEDKVIFDADGYVTGLATGEPAHRPAQPINPVGRPSTNLVGRPSTNPVGRPSTNPVGRPLQELRRSSRPTLSPVKYQDFIRS